MKYGIRKIVLIFIGSLLVLCYIWFHFNDEKRKRMNRQGRGEVEEENCRQIPDLVL
ncbi:MAG: hypothetical protein IJI25_06430 [Eubacterium sp.]|nr:hypothetical protein [Eubacterium sp.]